MQGFRSANHDENGPTKDSNLKLLNIASSVQQSDEFDAFLDRLVVDNDLFYGETANLTPSSRRDSRGSADGRTIHIVQTVANAFQLIT